MKKKMKVKTGKSKAELPELVIVMMKVAERLDALEKKMDQVIALTSARPSAPGLQTQSFQPPVHVSSPSNQAPRERTLYKGVCADCCKSCEVPFKPAEGRPIYCKACFTIRKAGHTPRDPDKLKPPHPPKKLEFAPMDSVIVPVLKGKKIRTKKKTGTSRKKKK